MLSVIQSVFSLQVTPFADKAAEAAASKAGEEKPEGEKAEASASTEETPKEFELKTDVVYGIALKDALKRLPAHVLRKRESRAKVERLKRSVSSAALHSVTQSSTALSFPPPDRSRCCYSYKNLTLDGRIEEAIRSRV